MNYNTQRIKDYKPKEPINPQLSTHFSEYLVLAVLKHHMSEKFKNAVISDRPDIQSKGLGVEVTIAENPETMQVRAEFSKYCQGNRTELRKKRWKKVEDIRLKRFAKVLMK